MNRALTLDCLVEPEGLVAHFLAHPPQDFRAFTLPDGTPAFSAWLDPLTTVDTNLRRRIRGLPGATSWLPRLRLRTCFVGTTVCEYATLARVMQPRAFVRDLLARFRDHDRLHSLLVIKDLPDNSPLINGPCTLRAHELAAGLREAGFALIAGQALAWVPIDFADIDEYLARLSRAARRDIRRKLRARDKLNVEVLPTGPRLADPALRAQVYRLYCNVYDQSEVRFDLLTRAFFDAVLQDDRMDGRVSLYRAGSRIIGFNLCFVAGEALVDKYVGFEYPHAREHNLYAVSWIHNLEFALANGLRRFIVGAADPQIKAHLGARFTFTRHAVYPRAQLLRAALKRLAPRFESDRQWFDARERASGRPGP
jgi:predicted N-acyltransferase